MANESDDDMEIISPSRSLQVGRNTRSVGLAEARLSAPKRVDPGGLITSIPVRWTANAQTKTYNALSRRSAAERSLVEADTELGHSLLKNARMRHEFAELPEILATDRTKRRLRRTEEIRELYHEAEMAETRRMTQLATANSELTTARTTLTQSRERLTTARRSLINAEQELEAQRQHGPRYHALGWQEKIGERELRVEEQQVILSEHRKRIAQGTHSHDSEEELYAQRAQLNADGVDTRAVDLAIERGKTRARG